MFSERDPNSEESLAWVLKTVRTQKIKVAFQSIFIVWASGSPEESVKMSGAVGYFWEQRGVS